MAAKLIQAIRGMNDILPNEISQFILLEKILRDIVTRYGYREIRCPIVESTELFARTIGESTDIVEKEMYTFQDRNGDSLTLRPEGTAGCVRAGIQHGLLYNQIQRLFYFGPMFRHERPQKGRYRQFYQFGVEAFGLAGPDIDAEILLMAASFWRDLKIEQKLELQINSLGNAATRAKYHQLLVNYFTDNFAQLDEDSQRRLAINPLRILDSKNPAMQELIKKAPKLLDCLDEESAQHFTGLCKILDAVGLPYVVNPCLVRGLDYYGYTVFEWVTNELGSQGAVCAGGHYDNLVGELGGKSTPAIGFAIGIERLLELAKDSLIVPPIARGYLVLLGESAVSSGMLLAEELRKQTAMQIITNCGGGNLSVQLKRADKSGADYALIIGDEELANDVVIVKPLRESTPQQSVKTAELVVFLSKGQLEK